MKAAVVSKARELGFDLCRIAPAERAAHADVYEQWVENECYGDMGWMSRNLDRRTDPRVVQPGAKSVIVLAVNYFQGAPPPLQSDDPGGARGRIARYAWGDDYHDGIEEKLKQLNGFLEELGGEQRYYVDTGPVLERDFANESGLGWNGKSTVQIHPELGTWFFLAVIITTLELEPDERMNDHCGKCTRCIDVCPTDAITADRRLDARLCISYLTIEHKGSIPIELRSQVGDRIYGCDECLDVCPWNRFAKESRDLKTFSLREDFRKMRLRDYLEMDAGKFRELFRKSPVKRTKYHRFLRNVCVALGNVGDESDLPALERAAKRDDEPLIAEHAQWAIERIRERNTQATSS